MTTSQEIGVVLQVDVLDVDLIDEPRTSRPPYNPSRVSIAIRRDALDTSALQILRIVQTAGARLYEIWKKNCGGLTYATTLADSMQTEHEAYLARLRTSVLTLGAVQTYSGRHVTFKIALTANPPQPQSIPSFSGRVTSADGTPVKDAVIELEAKDLLPVRTQSPSSPQTIPPLRTATDGSFSLPFLDPTVVYSLKVTFEGSQPLRCIVKILHDGRIELSSQR